MRRIVIDASCIIDLGKADLLDVALALPYMFTIPDALFETEALDPDGKKILRNSKLDVRELPGSVVERARTRGNRSPWRFVDNR